jgi:hypothetical protein
MPFTPPNFTVWMEIPVTDLDQAIKFYTTVLKTELRKDESGPNPIAAFPTVDRQGVAGHLYPGKPAPEGTGPTIHLACPDRLEDALERVEQAGGRVLSDVITIPPGRFAYCQDPDGNSIGIFSS